MTTETPLPLTASLAQAFTQVQAYCAASGKTEFEAREVHVAARILNELEQRFYLVLKYGSKAHTVYAVADEPGVRPAWAAVSVEDRSPVVPDNLFRGIVGYNEVKQMVLTAMQEAQRAHFLLIGPPAGGKSMFLDAIDELPESLWLQGGSTTRAGFANIIANADPRFIALDEADYLTTEDWSPLVEMMERGTVTVTNGNVRFQVERRAMVIAACNDYTRLPIKMRSRFMKVEMPAYTRGQFLNVAETVLAEREEIAPRLAKEMAAWSWHFGVRDIREVRQLARTCKTLDAAKAWLQSPYRFRDDGATSARRRR